MPEEKPKEPVVKSKLHPRNRHKHRYNFKQLIAQTPELGNYVSKNKYGVETINFFDSTAVKLLNYSLLKHDFGIEHWDIPEGYLCPPIPGRADYIHYAADLLTPKRKDIPTGKEINVLDVGTGANCIYPILGHCEYGWSFVASDIDPTSIKTASAIAEANSKLSGAIDVRLQEDKNYFFKNIIKSTEYFDLTICNPPFHSSESEAISANLRKLRNLKAIPKEHRKKDHKNESSFGGQHNELWCKGGELKFIRDMIKESKEYKDQVLWFTTLVSKHGNLSDIYTALKKVEVHEVKTIEMGQGNKTSRIVAWTFKTGKDRRELGQVP